MTDDKTGEKELQPQGLNSTINGDTSDGYHTFNELYEHRNLLFLLAVNELAWNHTDIQTYSYWVEEHYPGWDLVVLQGKTFAQISYHVPVSLRAGYENTLPKRKSDSDYDGHTSHDVIVRLKQLLGIENEEA